MKFDHLKPQTSVNVCVELERDLRNQKHLQSDGGLEKRLNPALSPSLPPSSVSLSLNDHSTQHQGLI